MTPWFTTQLVLFEGVDPKPFGFEKGEDEMATVETLTTKEAAKTLKVTVATFRKKAKAAGLEARSSVQTGKRGRPEAIWSKAQVGTLA